MAVRRRAAALARAPSSRRRRCSPTLQQRRHGHVVCLGEPLLCLQPHGAADDAAATPWPMQQRVAGPELLAACAASRLGQDASLVTVLPDTHLADPAEGAASAAGVTLKALYDADPAAMIGTVHLPRSSGGQAWGGRALAPAFPGRGHSAFAVGADGAAFGWATLLQGVDVLHTTLSTLALGPGVREAWAAAVDAAPPSVAVSLGVGLAPSEAADSAGWAEAVESLASAGRLGLLSLSAADVAPICRALGVGEIPGGRSEPQVAALALALQRLAEPAQALTPVVAVRYEARSEEAAGVRGWSVMGTARSGEGAAPCVLATTEHTPVTYQLDPSTADASALRGAEAAWLGGMLSSFLEVSTAACRRIFSLGCVFTPMALCCRRRLWGGA